MKISLAFLVILCLLVSACGKSESTPQTSQLSPAEYLRQANTYLGYATFPQWKESFDKEAKKYLELLVKHHPQSAEAAKARDMLADFPALIDKIKLVADLQENANFGNINAGQAAYDRLLAKYPDLKPRADAIWQQALKKYEKNNEKYSCIGNTVYVISGTAGSADLTYTDAGGGTSQQGGAALPRKVCFDSSPGQHLYIAAQSQSRSGWIKVQIYRDGQLLKQSESSGAFVIASASAN